MSHPLVNRRHSHKQTQTKIPDMLDSSFLHAAIVLQGDYWILNDGQPVYLKELTKENLKNIKSFIEISSKDFFVRCPSRKHQEQHLKTIYPLHQKIEKSKTCVHCLDLSEKTKKENLPDYEILAKQVNNMNFHLFMKDAAKEFIENSPLNQKIVRLLK